MRGLEKGFVVDGMRRCPMCATVKPVDAFNKQKRKKKSGAIAVRVKPYCKACTKILNARRTAQSNSANAKRWRTKNADRALAYTRAYCESEHGKRTRARVQTRRHYKQKAAGSFTDRDIKRLLEEQRGCCVGCGVDIRGRYTIDHILAISRGGSNDPQNLQLLCRSCNSSKHAKPVEQWLREIGRLPGEVEF